MRACKHTFRDVVVADKPSAKANNTRTNSHYVSNARISNRLDNQQSRARTRTRTIDTISAVRVRVVVVAFTARLATNLVVCARPHTRRGY